jgi:hypothetical protein
VIGRLVILGINVLVGSLLLATYGALVGESGLVGVAASLAVLGGVLVAYGGAAPETPQSILSYTRTLVYTITSTIEDLDLLDSNICVVRKRGALLVVLSKAPCPGDVDPGIGFASGSPYLAIPVDTAWLRGRELEIEESGASEDLETALWSLLVDELGLCRSLRVELEGGVYRVRLISPARHMVEFSRFPVDPYVLFTLPALAEVTKSAAIRLVDKRRSLEEVVIVAKVERVEEGA